MNPDSYHPGDTVMPPSSKHSPVDIKPAHATARPPSLQDVQLTANLPGTLDRPVTATPESSSTPCYWTLLSADLSFLYVDPMLASDLEEQGDLLLGRSLFEFVHPRELATARSDLGNVLGTRELHGSVTRVPFAGIPCIRQLLAYAASGDEHFEHESAATEGQYRTVDILVNWAAEGVVLCFLHFVSDDSVGRGPCGTSSMAPEQARFMYQRLLSSVGQPESVSRVFQLLWNSPERQLLVSWPPDRNANLTSQDFVNIAQQVCIGSTDSAKTACWRRFKSTRTYGGTTRTPIEVESIFIPHGTVVFACHKVHASIGGVANKSGDVPYATNSYGEQLPYHSLEQYPSSTLPTAPVHEGYQYQVPPQPQYDYNQWSLQTESPPQSSQYSDWAFQAPSPAHSRASGFSSATPYLPSLPDDGPAPPSRRERRSPSPYTRYGEAHIERATDSPAPHETLPGGKVQRRTSPPNARESSAAGSGKGLPPAGVTACSSCKVTHSPEWRKGPSGKKDLCNACGLRYARSKAKKDGISSQRRKKSTTSLRDDPISVDIPVYLRDTSSKPTTPDLLPKEEPHSATLPGFHDFRRASTDSGGYGRGFTGPGMLGRTPSPSPPSSAVHFSNYSYRPPQGDLRYVGSNSAYYDHGLVAGDVSSVHGSLAQQALPRLSTLAQYAALTRELPTPSPAASSPSVVAAFERRIDNAR